MKLDEIIPYIENIDDLYVAKTLLELESYPDGYYQKIYNKVNDLLKNNINQKQLKEIFEDYESDKAIKYIQYFNSIYDEIKGDKLHSLMHKKTFLKSILDIKDIYSLRLYLTNLNKKLKGEDITYNKYVPEYRRLI